MSKRVLIGMSGGIDSTVAAILLLEQGYELVGATFRTFDPKPVACGQNEKSCCSEDSITEAKHMAEVLGFEHHVLDFRDTFKEHVIANFVNEYYRKSGCFIVWEIKNMLLKVLKNTV